MSLVISAFWYDPDTGETQEFTDWEGGHYMAGTERARWDVWGSDVIKRRGARFLPQLAESNLWVAPEELAAFVAEVRLLLADLDRVCADLGWGLDSTLPHYLNNFLLAAEYAVARDGGVNIT